jgi:hypothetical protein
VPIKARFTASNMREWTDHSKRPDERMVVHCLADSTAFHIGTKP